MRRIVTPSLVEISYSLEWIDSHPSSKGFPSLLGCFIRDSATVKEVTYMVQRHQHYHRSAQHIDALQAGLIILLRTEEMQAGLILLRTEARHALENIDAPRMVSDNFRLTTAGCRPIGGTFGLGSTFRVSG